MGIPYNLNIPAASDNPSFSQGQMQTNCNSIDTWNKINHFTFQSVSAGKHNFVQMPQRVVPVILAGEGATYTQTQNARSQLMFTNDGTGNEYILTRVNDGNYATFGTNAYIIGNNVDAGWTFLPGQPSGGGAMLFQYGQTVQFKKSSNPITIGFPKTFSNPPFSITLSATKGGNSPSTDNTYVKDGTITAADFQLVTTDTSLTTVYWMAIGV